MEMAQLRHFVTIAQTLSFTKAAELAHMTQPALSYQMKRLEEELAVKLFHRHGRSIALTTEGEIFLPMAQSMLARANEAVRMVRDRSGIESGEVNVGLLPAIAAHVAPEILPSFHQAFPQVRVNLVENGDLMLQQMVSSGSVDFAIVGDLGTFHTLDSIPLGSEDLLAVTPQSHRLADQVTIELSQLRNDEFALPAPYHQFKDQAVGVCRRAGFEPRVAYHVGSLGTLRSLVRGGLAVSLLPASAVRGIGGKDMAVLRLKGNPTRSLFLLRSQDRDISRPAQVLLTQMRSAVSESTNQSPRAGRTRSTPVSLESVDSPSPD